MTTRPSGESGGARSHILGVMNAYRQLGWDVESFIYGDRIDLDSASGSLLKGALQGTAAGRMVADIGRVVLGKRNSVQALRAVGDRIDYVYERFAVFQSLGRQFKHAGVPWVLETQGLFYFEARHDRKSIALSRLAKKLELAAYRDCDVVVAVTETLKKLLVTEAKVPEKKILVVPNGVDTEKFRPRLRVGSPEKPRPVLGFVGGLLRWQGLDQLFAAVKAARAGGRDFDVVVVGDGEERRNLEQLASRLGISDRVEFAGRVDGDKVPDYIEAFDVCFSGHLPSQLGGMYHSPLKIYEYMAMAKPVIASDFSDARSVISGKGTGFLFESGNIASLAGVLIEVFANTEKLVTMGTAAAAEVVKNHSWMSRVANMTSEIDLRIGKGRLRAVEQKK